MALRPPSPSGPAARAFEGAFEASIAVVVGVVLGYYADRWLETEPVFFFIGFVVGAVAGFRRLLQIQWPGAPGQSKGSGQEEQNSEADRARRSDKPVRKADPK